MTKLSMKIYTKTGDKGETGLLGGIRVPKSHLAINACGSLDETNSLIGLSRSSLTTPRAKPPTKGDQAETAPTQSSNLFADIDQLLEQIQNDLFDLGSQVAACMGASNRPPDFPELRVRELELQIDQFQSELPPQTEFILPGGNQAGSFLHLARSVCRRTERDLVELNTSKIDRSLSVELIYLNRLGDLLFVLARVANVRSGSNEVNWDVGRANQKN